MKNILTIDTSTTLDTSNTLSYDEEILTTEGYLSYLFKKLFKTKPEIKTYSLSTSLAALEYFISFEDLEFWKKEPRRLEADSEFTDKESIDWLKNIITEAIEVNNDYFKGNRKAIDLDKTDVDEKHNSNIDWFKRIYVNSNLEKVFSYDIDILKNHKHYKDNNEISTLLNKLAASTEKVLKDIDSHSSVIEIKLATESAIVVVKEELTIESALEALHQDVKMIDQYYGILTTEDSIYVNKLKPFFIDGIQRISNSMSDLKDKLYMKSDVFKDKISDLDKYGKFNRNIKNLKFSTYEDMLFPIMLGTNVDYLTASQKLLKYPMLIDGLNNVILDFVHNLEQMMNENSNDRLTLRKHDDRYFNIVDAKNITSELINTLVNPKANSDQMKLEYLLPNFVSLDTIKDNFIAICKDLNKVDISKLEDNVDTLVKTISTWQQVVKEQTDTRHSTYMVADIKNNTVHIAELVTNIGMLITLTFQYITFYNRLIVILNTKTTSN